MKFLEKDLEQIIYESDPNVICQKGLNLSLNGKFKRQLKIGNYGISDLVRFSKTYDFNGPTFLIEVFELKKEKIGISALLQGVRYCRGIQSYLKYRDFNNYHLNLILIGKEVDTSGAFCFLPELINASANISSRGRLSKLCFQTYNYDIDGIKFKEERDYKFENEGFGKEGNDEKN